MIFGRLLTLPSAIHYSRSVFNQASEAQSNDNVLPVPVGDSSNALWLKQRELITLYMYSN